ncbi:hypothetical protein X797_007629 [Metarhizium robertsii]|uniref:Uncharacterized protein n=1 Tax=Metarhizium robertsii TaxID=568076 RepID=A0A014P7N2_9HYPO|nr:hypothetical protein X797_007629 [Metarhizium robertsii]
MSIAQLLETTNSVAFAQLSQCFFQFFVPCSAQDHGITKLPKGQHYEAATVGNSYKRADTRLGWSKSFRNMARKLKIRGDTQSDGLALLETCHYGVGRSGMHNINQFSQLS